MRTDSTYAVLLRLARWPMQFRMYQVVEKSLIRIRVDQRLLHKDKETVTLYGNDSEAALKRKLKSKSPCPEKIASFHQIVSRLRGTKDWVMVHPQAIDVPYTPDCFETEDCFEAELSIWVREALEFLSLDGTIEPMKQVTVPITKKLRTE